MRAFFAKHRWRFIFWGVFLVMFGLLTYLVWGSPQPDTVGTRDGRLSPCPASPNCVCSEGADPAHIIEPIRFSGEPADAWKRLQAALRTLPRTEIVTVTDDYLHAKCVTLLMRFTDDVECRLDPAGVIHVRSASRVGYSDLGVNRARIEQIRAAFKASEGKP